MKSLVRSITGLITILSGINIGLVGLFDYNAIHTVFGGMGQVLRAVHVLIGLSALIYGVLEFNENKMF